MAINFPTSLDILTNPTSGDAVATVSHAGQHADANDAIEALEAKVGVDSSAVNTSLDYKVKNAASVNPGHKHSALANSFIGASAYLSADQDNPAAGGAGVDYSAIFGTSVGEAGWFAGGGGGGGYSSGGAGFRRRRNNTRQRA